MKDDEQQREEQDEERVGGKRPYETPMLTKLGNVQQVTQGTPIVRVPDILGASF